MLQQLLRPLYRRLETDLHPMRYLFCEVTRRCNLDCRHCGSDCGRDGIASAPRDDDPGEPLSTQEWLDFFADLPQHFDPRRFVIVVTGGEPLCHPDFDRLAQALHEHRLNWAMVSNGYALDAPTLARLRALGLSSLTISLDGLRATHDRLRGRKGSFVRALDAIRLAAQSGLWFFDVVTCVHPANLAELPELQKLLEQAGVPAWRLFSIFPKGRAEKNKDLLLSPEQLRELFRFLADTRAEQPPRPMRAAFSCEGYLPPTLDSQVRDEPYFCRAGISIASVLVDGAIAACPNISRTLVQGNIRHDDFATVWEQRFAPYRDRAWMKTGPCLDCADWSRCLGNSLHLWDERQNRTVLCMRHVLDAEHDGADARRKA